MVHQLLAVDEVLVLYRSWRGVTLTARRRRGIEGAWRAQRDAVHGEDGGGLLEEERLRDGGADEVGHEVLRLDGEKGGERLAAADVEVDEVHGSKGVVQQDEERVQRDAADLGVRGRR